MHGGQESGKAMKLQGIRVVDLSLFLPGPYLTLLMADHGAEVIKVEPPGEGDAGREIGLSDGPTTVFFRNVNRGKKSVVLDLKSESGHAALIELVREADVFVESFRPGVMQRLGIDYPTLAAINPGLVYCSISAFGQDGPYVGRPAHDLAVEALAGMVGLTLGNDGRPAIPGIPVADIVSGLHGLAGVLMALVRRAATGKGDHLDISMLESMVSAMPNVMGPTFAEGRQPDPKLERSTGGAAFYRIYETADGRHVVLGAQEPKFVRAVLGKLGRADLVPLCLRGPGAHQQPVIEALSAAFASRTAAEWQDWFADVDAAFARVNTLPEMLDDPQLAARGFLLRDGEGRPHLGNPIRFRDEPAEPRLEAPLLGQDRAAAGRR